MTTSVPSSVQAAPIQVSPRMAAVSVSLLKESMISGSKYLVKMNVVSLHTHDPTPEIDSGFLVDIATLCSKVLGIIIKEG